VAGLEDREHFLDAQRRNRRASWRASIFAPVAVAAAGVPLCAVITPALYAPLLLAGHLARAVGALPPAAWQTLHDVAYLVPDTWAQLWDGAGPVPWGFLALLVVVPGAVAMVAAWLLIRATLRRAWVGGALRHLRARRPNVEVPEEQRLVNLVEEIAVAAAIRPPRVLVADVPSANVVVLGLGVDDATVVVTRGLLGTLDRAEQQAVVAYAVASVANGDLRVAATFMSVFHAWGLLGLLTDAPFTPRHRAALRFVARTLRRPVTDRAARAARRRAADLLLMRTTTEGGAFASDDVIGADHHRHPIFYGCLVQLPLLLTLGLASITFRATLELCTLLVFGPVMAWLWRSRRHTADATAVELTRDPEALAGAVRKLAGPPGVTAEAAALSFLCFVRATKTPQSVHDLPQRLAVTEFVVGMHPDPEDRLARLRALGAAGTELPAAARTPPGTAADVRTVLVWSVLAIALVALLLALNFVTTAALLYVVWKVLTLVFVTLPGWVAALA